MGYIFKCFLSLISMTFYVSADCISRTVFEPRSITCDAVYELALSNYDFYHNCSKHGCFFYVTPFYQQSFSGKKVAPYFLLHGKQCITFEQDGSGDVNPIWLGLLNTNLGQNYSSKLSVDPDRQVYGVHNAFFWDFDRYVPGLWFAVAFAVVGTKQRLNLCESDVQGAPGALPGIANGLEALNNPELNYGKFTNCIMSKVGLDDIQCKLGWNRFCDDGEQHQGVYGVLTLPTSSKPHNNFIFSPRVGTRHASLGFGANIDATVYEHDCRGVVHYMMDLKYRYLFRARECRSFDGCGNGEWSRFLQVVSSDQRSDPMPGINSSFTKNVLVTPRSQLEFWNAFHWTRCNWHAEIGWNLWVRQSESIKLDCCVQDPFGIYDLGADAQRQNAKHQQIREPISASRATISQSVFEPNAVPSDAQFTVARVNTKSGAHPLAVSNKLYGAYAYDLNGERIAGYVGMGASVEVASKHSAFDFWSVWAKSGLQF